MGNPKRIPFDRPQQVTITNLTLQILRDPERLPEGYERIYTVVSAVDLDNAPDHIRFGTGGEDRHLWHEEEPAPVVDTYYHTEREYHCRRHNRGIVGFYAATKDDRVIVNWHGYDKKVEL